MIFNDIGIITRNVPALAKFYEAIFNAKAEGDSIHCFVNAAGLRIALYDKSAAETDMGFDFSGAGNGMMTIGFDVDDVDAEYARIKKFNISGTTEPQLWPWGAKSFRFRDLDGNIIVFRSWPEQA